MNKPPPTSLRGGWEGACLLIQRFPSVEVEDFLTEDVSVFCLEEIGLRFHEASFLLLKFSTVSLSVLIFLLHQVEGCTRCFTGCL